MKMQDNIKEIRRLLALWYECKTDAEDSRRLAALLAKAENLPADLEAERRMFAALSEAAVTQSAVSEGLGSRLEEALDCEELAERRRKGRLRMAWVSAAASLLLVAGVAIKLIIPTAPAQQEPKAQIALEAELSKETNIANLANMADIAAEAVEAEPAQATPAEPARIAKAAQTAKAAIAQSVKEKVVEAVADTIPFVGGYCRVVTDPAEADSIASRVLSVLLADFSGVARTMEQVENIICNTPLNPEEYEHEQ